MAPSYDIIPDLHADLSRLERSLNALEGGASAAFLGDFIDAKGDDGDDAEVLTRVRGMVEAGAPAVMGNHELNAVLFHRLGSDGEPLRARSEKNLRQHRSFVKAFGVGTPAALEWTRWFLTLPLWRDLGGLRLVHACWSDQDIALIAARRPDGRLQSEDLVEVSGKSSPFAKAVDRLLTGPEAPLPPDVGFHDFNGAYRTRSRVAWWRSQARTWREAALSIPDPAVLPDEPVAHADIPFYSPEAPPVLVGHYKMPGAPTLDSHNAACLDYPKTACLYRWRGEARLRQSHLAIV